MLSPASSLELFIETKQQKRVKEERMYGQIVKEMSAVELSGTETSTKMEKGPGRCRQSSLKTESSVDESERMSSSPPMSDVPVTTKITIPVRSSAPHPPGVPRAESFTPPLQIITDHSPMSSGRDSPEDLDVDDLAAEPFSSPQSMVSSNDTEDADATKPTAHSKVPVSMLVQLAANASAGLSGAGGQMLVTDVAEVQQLFQFPSLRTISRVSWCFLNYTKPNSCPATEHGSAYSSWCVSSYNPNPLNLSTKAALALLRSKQRRTADLRYTTATMSPPTSGKLVSSVAWKLRFDQLKPELMPVEVSNFGRKMKGVVSWEHSKEEQVEKEVSVKAPPTTTEPTRIKIFEGGYKSNEDYVYVRGRGRGKYICEECGIRCKKPSMLKKHIRTHTDVRPYVCKFCNFAFKTKGNLTKHMKSKAHMKKCLELGVSMSSVDETDDADVTDEGQRSSEKTPRGPMTEHQFSDADDSDGGEEDGDEVEDDEDDEDDYDGDSTPKTRSRSTSPQPYSLPSLSITAVAASHPAPPLLSSYQSASDILGHTHRPPLFSYFTTVPSIQITPQAPPTDHAPKEHSQAEYQQGSQEPRLLAPPSSSSSMDEDLPVPSPDLSELSRLSSPGLDLPRCPSPVSPSSSPSSRRYLSPHRDLSPRAGHPPPHRDVSPLRHISPKRDVGGYRRDLSPRRGHLSLLSPLSRPTSPGGRDYKRDLSPRGRHRGMIRPLSPRRGLHPHLVHQSQQGGTRRMSHQSGLMGPTELSILGRHRTSAEIDTDHRSGSWSPGERDQGGNCGNQSSPPQQLLFSHLPLHSQLQVRSPFPMIPIGGIQMVHSIPSAATAPLVQQEAPPSRMLLQKSTSEDSNAGDAAFQHFSTFAEGGAQGGGGREFSSPSEREGGGAGGGAKPEQEEGVHTCTKAIASLCIDSGDPPEKGGGAGGGAHSPSSSPFPSPSSSDSQHPQRSPSISTSPPSHHSSPSPGIQHFRSSHPSVASSSNSSCSSPHTPPLPSPRSETVPPPTASKQDLEAESTQRSPDV